MTATASRASEPSKGSKQARELLRHIDELYNETTQLVLPAKSEHTVRQWAVHQLNAMQVEDGLNAVLIALSLATDLETFTPSHTGMVAIDRLARQRQRNAEQDVAYDLIRKARFTPFVLVATLGDGLHVARNLVTEQTFTLLDDEVPPGTHNMSLVARLCALGDGLYGAVGMMTPLHPDGLAVALQFVPARQGDHERSPVRGRRLPARRAARWSYHPGPECASRNGHRPGRTHAARSLGGARRGGWRQAECDT